MVWRQWRRRMLEQASERARAPFGFGCTPSRPPALAKCDGQTEGAKNGIFAWPLAPSHFRPIPANGLLSLPFSLSLGVSDYSARIKSGLPCFNARARAGSGNPGPACLSAYLGRARCLVIEPFPLQFPNSQAAGVKMKRRRRRNGMSVGEEDGDFFSKFALMTPPS